MLGAYRGNRLVGFAVLGPKLPDESAELCALLWTRHLEDRESGR